MSPKPVAFSYLEHIELKWLKQMENVSVQLQASAEKDPNKCHHQLTFTLSGNCHLINYIPATLTFPIICLKENAIWLALIAPL